MTTTRPEENTLGVVINSARKRRGPESERVRRILRPADSHRPSLGASFIGVGAAIVCGLRVIYGLALFVGSWDAYPNPLPALVAWVLLASVLVLTFVATRLIGDTLPDWAFAIFLTGLAATVALDLVAVWPLHDIGSYASASVASGMALVIVVTVRGPREILVATSAIGLALAVAMVLNTPLTPDTIAQQVTTLAFAVLPAVVAVVLMSGFRRLVQVELDRVLVQSTVSAPRFAVGMMASEELARLDLAAEELLESVASGKTQLPLDPKTASKAASLATELRLHLIEGRRETWLYHAVTESDLLGKSVTLVDKNSLAGLLDPAQRDGLLSAAWLIVTDTPKAGSGRTVHLELGPASAPTQANAGRKVLVPIVLTTTGVPRNRVDPATWDAIRKVGQYSDSTQNQSLRVDIACLVDNPAD